MSRSHLDTRQCSGNQAYCRVLSLVAALLACTACSDVPDRPTSPNKAVGRAANGIELTPRFSGSPDDELELLARDVPGFGGYATDGSSLTIILTDPEHEGKVALERVLPFLLKSGRFNGVYAGMPVKLKQGKFEFRDLARWHRGLMSRGIPKGVEYTAIDKARNTLTIGVTSASAEAQVLAELAALGVPRDAASIERVSHFRFMTALTDRVRPVQAGFKFARAIVGQSGAACTVGMNVTASVPGNYLLTASHCTGKAFGAESDSVGYYQPNLNLPDSIGREAYDPSPWTGTRDQWTCPTGKVCRMTDAALILYNPITAPAWNVIPIANSSTVITGYATVAGDHPLVNTYYLTGYVSGTSTTSVANATFCVNVFPDSAAEASVGIIIPGNLALLCQTIITGLTVSSGDSGGPVFGPGLVCQYDENGDKIPGSCQNRLDNAVLDGVLSMRDDNGKAIVSDADLLWVDFGFNVVWRN